MDTSTRSAILVSTRIKRLLPGCCQDGNSSFPLSVLAPHTAVALLLEVSNAPAIDGPPPTPETHPLHFEAVEACGRLPLAVAVAGSMLESLGGEVDAEFLRLLTGQARRVESPRPLLPFVHGSLC